MIKKSSRLQELILFMLPVLSIVITAVLYHRMPDKIPAGYALSGQVSQYTSKSLAIFIIPILSLLYYIYLLLVPRIDAKRDNYTVFQRPYNVFRFTGGSALLMINLIYIASIFYPNRSEWAIAFKVFLAVSLLFFGDRLPKVKKNHFIGVINPWTLRSNAVWHRTQRFTGKFIVITAIILLLISFISIEWVNAIYASLLLVLLILPHIYSANIYFVRKNQISGGN